MDMDVDEPGDGKIISHAIGFSAAMEMGLLAEINALWTNVSVSLLSNYVKGLTTLV